MIFFLERDVIHQFARPVNKHWSLYPLSFARWDGAFYLQLVEKRKLYDIPFKSITQKEHYAFFSTHLFRTIDTITRAL